MSHNLFNSLKRSQILLIPENESEQNWAIAFQMMISLAKNYNCSFHLLDLNQVIEHYFNWIKLLPRVRPYFAHTFQRDPKISYFLGNLGCGFSCSTFRESNDCITGVSRLQTHERIAKDIILSNPFKLGSDMKNCRLLGLKYTCFMNKSELDKIKIYWPDAELLISVATNKDLYNYEMTISKMAAPLENVDELLDYAKKLDLRVVGLICFHGTHFKTMSNDWDKLPAIASGLVDKIEMSGFGSVKIVSLGDGFESIDQENEEQDWLAFQHEMSALSNQLDEYFPPSRNIQLIAQPARYFAQKAELFAFKVMGKRIRNMSCVGLDNPPDNDEKEQTTTGDRHCILIVENSQYMSFNYHPGRGQNKPNYWLSCEGDLRNLSVVHDLSENDTPSTNHNSEEQQDENNNIYVDEGEMPTTLYGNTCDSLDIISEDISLPGAIAVGDYLVWVNRGCFSSCMMSQFNGMKPPKHFHFINEKNLKKFMDYIKVNDISELDYGFLNIS